MANIPVMRQGRLVKSALSGVDIDKLSDADKLALHKALNKSEAGKTLNADDLQSVVKARRTAPAKGSTLADVGDQLAQLKRTLSK